MQMHQFFCWSSYCKRCGWNFCNSWECAYSAFSSSDKDALRQMIRLCICSICIGDLTISCFSSDRASSSKWQLIENNSDMNGCHSDMQLMISLGCVSVVLIVIFQGSVVIYCSLCCNWCGWDVFILESMILCVFFLWWVSTSSDD